MFSIAYAEAAFRFADVIDVVFRAMVSVDAITIHRISLSFVGGAEDTLEFPACSEVGLDTSFVEGAFQLV